jgi:NAD(P)-dependent dehydrogenase (short-subunit alcohol dehydrogenase family)
LTSLGVKACSVQADLSDERDFGSLIARAKEAAGGLDILVNNASVFAPSTMKDVTFEGLVEQLKVNAWAPFTLSRDFARVVPKGKIVNLLDTRVAGYDWRHVSYILSKDMLATLTRMMAIDFAPDVTVNAVAPGLILPPAGKDESYLQRLAQSVPLKRHGEPEDIAAAALYLLKNDYLTGQVIFVDGGRFLMEVDAASPPRIWPSLSRDEDVASTDHEKHGEGERKE